MESVVSAKFFFRVLPSFTWYVYILESRIFSIVIYYAFITSILTLVVNRFVDFQGTFEIIFVTRKDPFLKRVSKVAYDECSYLSSNDRRIRRTIMDERYNNTANHPSLRLDQSRVSRASLLQKHLAQTRLRSQRRRRRRRRPIGKFRTFQSLISRRRGKTWMQQNRKIDRPFNRRKIGRFSRVIPFERRGRMIESLRNSASHLNNSPQSFIGRFDSSPKIRKLGRDDLERRRGGGGVSCQHPVEGRRIRALCPRITRGGRVADSSKIDKHERGEGKRAD